MSPKVEKLDKWHFAQSLLKKSQIIESNQQIGKGRKKSIKQAQSPLESGHTRSQYCCHSSDLPGSLPDKAQAIKMSLGLVAKVGRGISCWKKKNKIALQKGPCNFNFSGPLYCTHHEMTFPKHNTQT